MKLFQSLRGKLILTYTTVTVLALLALEVLVLAAGFTASGLFVADRREYLGDVIATLNPVARAYLQPGQENLPGLQAWLEETYISGKASLDPQGILDSPAARIVQGDPVYVLSLDNKVIAQAPVTETSLVGRPFTPPDFANSWGVLEAAYKLSSNPLEVSTETPDGHVFMAVPVFVDETHASLAGVIVMTLEPPPSILGQVWPLAVGWVVLTGFALLIAVAPFGAVFGLVMSRSLTRRLEGLTTAVDAWSEGRFDVQPQDRAKDELSYLALRMRRMAENIQNLLQSRQQLALMEERNRLARELHDTVKQQTFATLMQVRAAKNLLESDPSAARNHLEDAEGLIKTSQEELGMIISELRPATLAGQGLASALQEYLHTWEQHTQIPVSLQVRNDRKLPLETELGLYRIAQEALANIARHSRASEAKMELVFEAGWVCLVVRDNGVGFDAAEVEQTGGFGLHSIHERATALGGTASVHSEKGEGTVLTARIPV